MNNSLVMHAPYCICNLSKEKPSTFFANRPNALRNVKERTTRNVFKNHENKICQFSSRLGLNFAIRSIFDKLANIWLLKPQLHLDFKFNIIDSIFRVLIKIRLLNNLYSNFLIIIFYFLSQKDSRRFSFTQSLHYFILLIENRILLCHNTIITIFIFTIVHQDTSTPFSISTVIV